MARLDRLGPAREVAQIGSVIGRGFSYGLIRDVAGMEDAALQTALEKLAEADIVLVQGLPPESDYRFKHALIQDAAYENLLKSRRQVLHRRAAEVLRDRFADTAAAEPEALAYHFTQSGMTDAAIEWWGKAGDQALRRSAFQEAIAHLGKAIEMADSISNAAPVGASPHDGTKQRLKLQTNYGQAVMLSRGFAAEETKAAFTRATELAAGFDHPAESFVAYYGLWTGNLMRGETRLARETAERFCREADSGPWPTDVAVAYRCLGLTCLHQGDFVEARASFTRTLQIYDPAHDRDAKFRFGMHPAAAAPLYLAYISWLWGQFEQASELIGEAIARAAETAHVPTQVNLYHYISLLETVRGDVAAAQRASQTVLELSREHGATLYAAVGALSFAWARARLAAGAMDPTELREALTAYTSLGNKLWVPLFQGLLAEIEAGGRELDGALVRIDEAIDLATDTGQHWTDAFLHCVRGDILIKGDRKQLAEEAFLTAITIAQKQKARSFELRAALSLAKLYQSTGRAAEAHTILTPALEGFSRTPEFPEIAEAQALLDALAKEDRVREALRNQQHV
jgi:tetratricopeptide (TPR) repeat protein